jgi:hypothetical protein
LLKALEHEMIDIGSCQRRLLVDEATGVFGPLLDGTSENHSDSRMSGSDPFRQRAPAFTSRRVGENEVDFHFQHVKKLHGFIAIFRFDDLEVTIAKVLRQPMTDDNISFKEKDNGGICRHVLTLSYLAAAKCYCLKGRQILNIFNKLIGVDDSFLF